MATKPKGIYIIAEQANHERKNEGQPLSNMIAWYVPLETNETLETATQRAAAEFAIGQRIAVVSDANAVTYNVAPSLTPTT